LQLPTKATHQQTREFNVRLALRTLYDSGPISRAEISRRTRLTRTTVSDVIAGLVADGLVEEVGRGPSSGGKAPILLRVVPDARQVIGLDLGEEAFTGALVDLRGEVRHEVSLPVGGRDGDDALALVDVLVERLLALADRPLLGIGVGTPGVIDAVTGVIRWAVNLDWQDLPLGRVLEERFGLPVQVVNDSRAAAVAVHTFGLAGARVSNLVAIKVGRGIGAGIVLGGELVHGDGFGAGEIGHLVVADSGERCRCGRSGCLETVASAGAIVRSARRGNGTGREWRTAQRLGLDEVLRDFQRGERRARTAVLAAGRYLGAAIAAIIGVMDIHRVVLHGSVTAFGDPWLDAVRDATGARALGLLTSGVRIDVVNERANLAVLGASAMLMTNQLGLSLAR
jgi:predicted NBD/HSP70 family sugar kinase